MAIDPDRSGPGLDNGGNMKLNGKRVQGPNVEVIVLPRGQGDDLVFKAQAVLDIAPFEKLCPRPVPPEVIRKGGIRVSNVEDAGYRAELQEYGKLKMAWMLIESLRATEGLEWETVRYEDSSTWLNYERELRDSGLGEAEITRLITGMMSANALNEDRIAEARERFFTSGQSTQAAPSSQTDGQSSTPSGEPASA